MLKLILTTALAHAAMATDHPLSAERFEAIQGSASRTWETVEPYVMLNAWWFCMTQLCTTKAHDTQTPVC